MRRLYLTALVLAAIAVPARAQSEAPRSSDVSPAPDAWAFRAALYGWFPSLDATATFPVAGGGTVGIETRPGSYLSKLQFALMGTLEARKGPWSIVADAIYVDFGNTGSNLTSIGGGRVPLPVPLNAEVDLEAFAGTLALGHALVESASTRLDLVGGARYLTLRTKLDWHFAAPLPGLPQQGQAEVGKSLWDGVVGLRGRTDIAGDWYVSYYADVGTGSSQSTWQAFAGLGRRFDWGDALIGYRYLAYHLRGDEPLSDVTLGGPLAGVAFRF